MAAVSSVTITDYLQNTSAHSVRHRITGICCGHALSHWPQAMQSEAAPA